MPSSALMAPMTKAFVDGVEVFVASTSVPLPLITFGKGERKDDVRLQVPGALHRCNESGLGKGGQDGIPASTSVFLVPSQR